MIARLIKDTGQEATFHLRDVTIPPCYLIRSGIAFAQQPDYRLPPIGFEICVVYRQVYFPNIDIYDPMSTAQIADMKRNGVLIENPEDEEEKDDAAADA